MTVRTLTRDELWSILMKNWMTHDALWYGEVAMKLGMSEASPMNLRVCRKLGTIEYKRYMKMVGISQPRNMDEFREHFEAGQKVFVPEFIDFNITYLRNNTMVTNVDHCFAHAGMEQMGVLADYECGIFERIEGWFDAMGVKYALTPDLSRCLKLKGEECKVTVKFEFE